jgi:hypothetical protein
MDSNSIHCISEERKEGDDQLGHDEHGKNRDMKLKVFGVTEEEMKRWNALKKLGLSNDDFNIGSRIMTIIPKGEYTKQEQLTGYTMEQIKRAKALVVLGLTEEDIDLSRAKLLGSLGNNEAIAPPASKNFIKRSATVAGTVRISPEEGI